MLLSSVCVNFEACRQWEREEGGPSHQFSKNDTETEEKKERTKLIQDEFRKRKKVHSMFHFCDRCVYQNIAPSIDTLLLPGPLHNLLFLIQQLNCIQLQLSSGGGGEDSSSVAPIFFGRGQDLLNSWRRLFRVIIFSGIVLV